MRVTRQSPTAMVAFTAFMFVVPYQLGKVVLWATNPEEQTALEKRLRERSTLEHRVRVCLLSTLRLAVQDTVESRVQRVACCMRWCKPCLGADK